MIIKFLENMWDKYSRPKNHDEWLAHFESEAAKGSTKAMTELGWEYIRDDGFFPRNEIKAWAWFDKAIIHGGDREIFEYSKALALCNNHRFFDVIEKAILHDYAPAFCLTGHAWKLGLLADKDFAKALHYYRLAADRGHIPAKVLILRLERRGVGLILSYLEIIRLMFRYARIWWRDKSDPRVLM